MINEVQKKALKFITDLLNQNNIEFQVSGGMAAIAYGAHRPLYDIDLEIYHKNVATVRLLLKEFVVQDWNHELDGAGDHFDLWMMTLNVYGVPVDINQIEGSRVYSKEDGWVELPQTMNTKVVKVEGVEIPVQKKEDLIAYKKLLSRPTDLDDISQIS